MPLLDLLEYDWLIKKRSDTLLITLNRHFDFHIISLNTRHFQRSLKTTRNELSIAKMSKMRKFEYCEIAPDAVQIKCLGVGCEWELAQKVAIT